MDLSNEPRQILEMYGTQGADGRSPPTACWPAVWPSAACGSSSFTIATGTTMARSRSTCRGRPPKWTKGGRADQGSETARHARRNAGHLGRRIRPHADGPGQWPRPPHQGFLDLDGRRRHQGGHRPRRDRRIRLFRRRTTSFTCTTCTRRSSPSWASTTRNSSYRTQGRDFRLTDVAGQVVKPILALTAAEKNKPNLSRTPDASRKRFGLRLLCSTVSMSSEEVSPAVGRKVVRIVSARCRSDRWCVPTARVGVGRGQHAQQGRATAGTTRTNSTTNPGDGPGPFKPVMHRCVFLGIRFVHQTKPPQGET